VTCHDARERFSELIDERLTAADRAALDAHLGECPACRAELDVFRSTVTLVRSLGPARAPAHLADRVIAAARQATPPRVPRRLSDRLLFPLPVKVPLQAAALLLVGVGVAYLFRHTPDLQQAARVDTPIVAEQREAPAPPPAPTAVEPPSAPASSPPPPVTESRASDARQRDQGGARTDALEAKNKSDTPEAGRKAEAPASTVESARRETEGQSRDAVAKLAPAPASPAPSPAPEAAAPPPPAAATAPQQRILKDSPRGKEAAPPAEAPARILSTGDTSRRAMTKSVAAADVMGTLTVASRTTAESALRELVVRHRGQIVESTGDPGAATFEVTIPRAAFSALVADLQALGRWRVDRLATNLPDTVRMTVRVSE
jgi:hypothetical protein